ncbi:hypothetical protein A3K86_11100 [Photobacterium jeanii]|uniref:Uncharacterized protein n=1 Tax=Photobacterium jeanii TaxID=858640 RepID=A0A178K9W3_9GAMM|nr:hypothetical protein [Photobacterium jeanii]OAN14128.1 hypothetical protein A3K86_11100 [Photobacterium jeanii]PST89645.1 hypothetical protein C9I91_11710 [Photobacterium jeanii]
MRNLLFTLTLLVVALPTTAADKELLSLINTDAPSGWFMSSQSKNADQFDLWQIDSGYAYSLNNDIELYLSTRLTSGNDNQSASRGMLSGVNYKLTPKMSLRSAVTTEKRVDQDATMGLEVSSQYQVTDKVNLHATIDYEDLEQIYQFGIGFRF